MGRIPTPTGPYRNRRLGRHRPRSASPSTAAPMFRTARPFPGHPRRPSVTALGALACNGISPLTGLIVDDLAFFAGRVWQLGSPSCPARRLAELESVLLGGASPTPKTGRRPTGSSWSRARPVRWSPPRPAAPVPARSATCSSSSRSNVFDPTAGLSGPGAGRRPPLTCGIEPWRAHLDPRSVGRAAHRGARCGRSTVAAGRITGPWPSNASNGGCETVSAITTCARCRSNVPLR